MKRREFLQLSTIGGAATILAPWAFAIPVDKYTITARELGAA